MPIVTKSEQNMRCRMTILLASAHEPDGNGEESHVGFPLVFVRIFSNG
jgi:hypothetical protein